MSGNPTGPSSSRLVGSDLISTTVWARCFGYGARSSPYPQNAAEQDRPTQAKLATKPLRLNWKLLMLNSRMPKRLERPRRRADGRECPAHRAWVRRHHCSVLKCNRRPIECAHIRGGTDGGIALKPSDRWVISLCSFHHAEQHLIGEQEFERRYHLDLVGLAEEFCSRSPHWSKLIV